MSDNYSVHHFQRTGGGNVTGGVTIPQGEDGGGIPATTGYFDYTINFTEPNGNTDYAGLNETDPIIDVDIDSRTIRMLAKKSFIEIVDNKELYNDTEIDTANMLNITHATEHRGNTNFKDNVKIDKELLVLLQTIIEDKLTVFKETHLKDKLTVDLEALFKSDVLLEANLDVEGLLTSDDFYYNGGGTSGGRLNAFKEEQALAAQNMQEFIDGINARLIAAEAIIADL